MSRESELIRGIADDMMLRQRAAERQAAQEAAAQSQQPPARISPADTWDQNAQINTNLIDRFIGWADTNNIDYDSPSFLARGWRLGVRTIALRDFRKGTSDGNIYDELSGPVPETMGHEYSLRSLIAKRSGKIGEIRIVGSTEEEPENPQPDFFSHLQIAMSAVNTIGRYRPMTIVRSIARLSAKYRVRWDA